MTKDEFLSKWSNGVPAQSFRADLEELLAGEREISELLASGQRPPAVEQPALPAWMTNPPPPPVDPTRTIVAATQLAQLLTVTKEQRRQLEAELGLKEPVSRSELALALADELLADLIGDVKS